MNAPHPPGEVLRQGSIVWAPIADFRGHVKRRPCVILTATDEVAGAKLVSVAAITTTFATPCPANLVELPWDARGTTSTGLRRRSAVVCDWRESVPRQKLEATAGWVPPMLMLDVIRRVLATRNRGGSSN